MKILYLIGFAVVLGGIIWWLVRYSTDITQNNGMPAWTPGGFLQAIFSPRSRDTTVSAYARQVHEHDLLLDERVEAAMGTVKEREFTVVTEQTKTQEYTGA